MAGHSKWANIKHRKGAKDKKRGKIFQKLSKEIYVAAKLGGGELANNASLRLVVEKAKAQNMPKDNIERAIKKGSGKDNKESYESITYEGYGPEGSAFIIDCLTDNTTRTAGSIRGYFNKVNGSLSKPGSVKHLFSNKGEIIFSVENLSKDKIDRVFDIAIENNAIDIDANSEHCIIETNVEDFETIKKEIDKIIEVDRYIKAEVGFQANDLIEEFTTDGKEDIEKLVSLLEDDDDVNNIYYNFN